MRASCSLSSLLWRALGVVTFILTRCGGMLWRGSGSKRLAFDVWPLGRRCRHEMLSPVSHPKLLAARLKSGSRASAALRRVAADTRAAWLQASVLAEVGMPVFWSNCSESSADAGVK